MKNSLIDMQNWCQRQCNGDWEHLYGLKIDTIDNPGWSVEIDIIETDCENKSFNEIDLHNSEVDWIQCNVKDSKFTGACGVQNLNELIQIFIDWSKST